MRDPWLPPVISTCSTSPRGLGWMRKNSSRTGSPVTSVRPLGKKRGGLRERRPGARDEAGDRPIGEARDGVRLHHDHGNAAQQRRHDRRSGDVAAHAEDGGGVADAAVALTVVIGRRPSVANVCRQADAIQSADLDRLELEALGRDQLALPCRARCRQRRPGGRGCAVREPPPAPESRVRRCRRPPSENCAPS